MHNSTDIYHSPWHNTSFRHSGELRNYGGTHLYMNGVPSRDAPWTSFGTLAIILTGFTKMNFHLIASLWLSIDAEFVKSSTHFFSLFPPPVSRKPFAKGLLSIFSWVICKKRKQMIRVSGEFWFSSCYCYHATAILRADNLVSFKPKSIPRAVALYRQTGSTDRFTRMGTQL